MKIIPATEQAHLDALLAYRKALRAGDLPRAERWLRCAERCHRLTEQARRDADEWKQFKRRMASSRAEEERQIAERRAWARQLAPPRTGSA